MIRIKLLTFLLVMMSAMAWSQSYVQLVDGSGYVSPNAQDNLSNLNTAASGIIASLGIIPSIPEGIEDDFKVYDFGFYLHQQNFDGGYPTEFEKKVQEIEALSPYYILFGRQTDESGVNTKLWVKMVLPDIGGSCMR